MWVDDRNARCEIYYKRSQNNGTDWGTDTRLTVQSGDYDDAYYPSLAVIDSFVHVVWYNNTDGNSDIYYKRSTNRGLDWGSSTRLTTNGEDQMLSSIAVSDSFVYVVWRDNRDKDYEIYYARSSNQGVTWVSDIRLSTGKGISNAPSIAASDSFVHVVWADTRDNWPYTEIYYKKSIDNGKNWGSNIRLTNDVNNYSNKPSVAVSDSNVDVVWSDNRPENFEIYYKNSTNNGTNWGADTRITNDNSMSISPSVAVSGTNVQVVWNDNRDENWEVYYKNNSAKNKGKDNRKPNVNKLSKTNFQITDNHKNSSLVKLSVYGNPAREFAMIKYSTSEKGCIRIRLFDISGKVVKTLFEGERLPGSYTIRWFARDDYGRLLPTGIYNIVIEMDGRKTREKILLVR